MTITHAPRFSIDAETSKLIAEYGLIHFTFSRNASNIIENGLIPDDSKKMSFLEKNMVWFFPADSASFSKNLAEVRSKGARKDVDTIVLFKKEFIPMNKLKMRKNPKAIIHIGKVDPNYIEVMDIPTYIEKYLKTS